MNTTIKGVGEAMAQIKGIKIEPKAAPVEPTQEIITPKEVKASKKAPKGAKKATPKVVNKGKTKVGIKHLGKKAMVQFLVDNPKVALELEELHHKYVGKQACNKARAIRKRLRRQGIYLSKLGHTGPRHD